MQFPKDRDPKKIEEYWTEKAAKVLLGKKIVEVEYLPIDVAKEWMWDKRPISFRLEDDTWITAQMDDEGNDGGVLAYTQNSNDDYDYECPGCYVMPVL